MAKYLDDNGLSYLWQKIKAHVNTAIAAIGKVPTGGTAGQILAKASGTDYDTEWITNSGGSGNYLPLSGGEMTGVIVNKFSNGAIAQNVTTGTNQFLETVAQDEGGTWFASFVQQLDANRRTRLGMSLRNMNNSGTWVSNGLNLYVAKDGTPTVTVDQPAAWRTAIGASYSNATSLYDNSSGTTGTVTLSQTAANFSILEIFFCDIDGNYSSVRVWSPNGKVVSLTTSAVVGTNLFFISWTRRVYISGTSISNKAVSNYSTGRFYIYSNGTTGVQSDNYIKITKVLGWKG